MLANRLSSLVRRSPVLVFTRATLSGSGGKKRPTLKWRLFKWTLGPTLALVGGYYSWKYIKWAMRPTFDGPKKKVVILGSGWGALSVINHLTPGQFDVTVVSPRNYFLFTPLLPSVTVGTVEARSIVEPLRKLIRRVHGGGDNGVEFLESECVDIDPVAKTVHCEDRSGIVGAVSEVHVSIYMTATHTCTHVWMIGVMEALFPCEGEGNLGRTVKHVHVHQILIGKCFLLKTTILDECNPL